MEMLGARSEAIRRFNRFYTQKIGVLEDGLYRSPFSLTEVRVLYELGTRLDPTASEIGRDLGLDAGYLSRILRGFATRGLLERVPSAEDGRRTHLRLTESGRAAFIAIDSDSAQRIGAMLTALPDGGQERLVSAIHTIEALLDAPGGEVTLRTHRPGDIGWIIQRHGALYASDYGWDSGFEALVAGIGAAFLEHFDAARERCWIAERDGARLGSVMLVKADDTTAKLRLLLVEPAARGHGVGRRLVRSCTEFARQAGYRRIMLWTNSILTAARAIYAREGYRLIQSEPHHSFGHDLIGETWELAL
jgi:DNA-binding MarR family transcriptional regulator/N-acetylglutamate synthase-like GNAT family acetyltransferase